MAGNNFFTNNGSGSPLQPKKPSLAGIIRPSDTGVTPAGTPYGTGVNTALYRQQQKGAGVTPAGTQYGAGVNTAQQRQAQSGMFNKPTTPTATPTPTAPITPATTATTPSQITPVTNAPTGYQQTNPNVYGQMTVDLANRYTQPIGQYQQIQDELARNAEEQRALQQAVAERGQQIGTSGIDLSLATGEKGLLNQLQAIKLGGLQQKQQALAGMLGAANTQQGLQQQALGSAISAARPELAQYGQTYYTPTNVSGAGGQAVLPTDPFYKTMQNYAQLVANNQLSAVPSSVTSNPVLNAQLLTMAKEINPNFNYNVSQGIAGGQATQGGAVAGYTSAMGQAQNLGEQLKDLIATKGVNPANINAVNKGIQLIASNVSDPDYATFKNYINDIANTYAQVLTPPNGNTTDLTRQVAQSLLDSSMKGTGIVSVMNSLDNAVQAKIAGTLTPNLMGGTQTATAPKTATTSAFTAGTKNATGELVWDGSKWTPAK